MMLSSEDLTKLSGLLDKKFALTEQTIERKIDQKLDERFDLFEQRLDQKIDQKLDERFDLFEQRLDQKIDQKLDKRFALFEQRLNQKIDQKLDERFALFEQKMDQKMDERFAPILQELQALRHNQEKIILPRLQTIESCYLSTYKRYQSQIETYEQLQQDVSVLKAVVANHSIQLQKLAS